MMTTRTRTAYAGFAALVLFAVVFGSASVRGDTNVFVDADLVRQCAGNTPCLTTIQAGVAAAEDPDAQNAGDTASVFIFPGTYAESVDLSDINGGTSIGDLRLIGVDADGNPAAGQVTIDATTPTGPAIHDGGGGPFDGTVVIDGFTVLGSGGFRGIDLNTTGGLTFANIVANGNPGGDGIEASAQAGTVMLTDCTASGNDIDGIDVFANSGDLHATRLTAIGNGGNNIDLQANGSVFVTDCMANDGAMVGAVLTAAVGLEITGLIAIGNDSNGAELSTSSASISLADSLFTNNNATGVEVDSAANLTVERTTFDDNIGFGVFYGVPGDVSMMEISADENRSSGVRGSVLGDGTTRIVQSHANRNMSGGDGFEIFTTMAGTLNLSFEFEDVETNENDGSGVQVEVDSPNSTASIVNCEASGNGISGYDFDIGDAVSVMDSVADYNAGDSGVSVITSGDIDILRARATLNGVDGFNLYSESTIDGENMTANFNGRDGVNVQASPKMSVSIQRLTAIGNGLLDNQGDGLDLHGQIGGLSTEVTVLDSLLRSNARDGLTLTNIEVAGTHRVRGCIICDNIRAGLFLIDSTALLRGGVTVNATGNWWGAANGPDHPNNATGDGDDIEDVFGSGDGLVMFDPWIDTLTASASSAVVNVGEPVTLEFQFSGGSDTVFLGPAPGDETGELPFNIHTTNGELTGPNGSGASIVEGINQSDGVLSVTLVPDTPGTATVWLDGPCALDAMLSLTAISADLSVTKTDDADPVDVDGAVVYTIDVTNNGPDNATNVTLTDTLPAQAAFVSATPSQGTCAEAAGVVTCNLGALANAASATVTVTVTATTAGVTMVNTATVAADEGDADLLNNTAIETTTVNPPPSTQPGDGTGGDNDDGMSDCGAGLCGFGTLGVMPFMLLGLGLMRVGMRRRR